MQSGYPSAAPFTIYEQLIHRVCRTVISGCKQSLCLRTIFTVYECNWFANFAFILWKNKKNNTAETDV